MSSSNDFAEAKRFLPELANLSDDPKAVERFERLFARFLPWAGSESQTLTVQRIDSGEDGPSTKAVDLSNDRLFSLRDALRSIWAASDLETKEWGIFLFGADSTMTVSFASSVGPPPPNPFQQAVMYLFKLAGKTRLCQNSECPSPYFLASRSSQKYCSQVCALPAQCSYKRDWWKKYGKEWRKRRSKRPDRRNRR
jgi:hypothetical protein